MYKNHFYINSISDIPVNTKYILLYNYSYSFMGEDYGPPDPPPTMETHRVIKTIAFTDESSLKDWISKNSKEKFTVIKYEPVKISTEIVVTLS